LETYDESSPTFFLIEINVTLVPDLDVLDQSLPVAEGANIARQLHGRYPALRVIVLSVYHEPALTSQLLKSGAADVVLKRMAATDLLPAIQAVLRRGEICFVGIASAGGSEQRSRNLPSRATEGGAERGSFARSPAFGRFPPPRGGGYRSCYTCMSLSGRNKSSFARAPGVLSAFKYPIRDGLLRVGSEEP
jgi:hypothetical protein